MMIFEAMGRPKDHLTFVMDELIKKIDQEKGISITNKDIHEPKLIENKDDKGEIIKYEEGKEMFSNFCELGLEADTLMDLMRVLFLYMPAHIEVISPSNFELKNFDLGAIANEIIKKLHNYDAIAKSALIKNKILEDKLKEYIDKEKEDKKD